MSEGYRGPYFIGKANDGDEERMRKCLDELLATGRTVIRERDSIEVVIVPESAKNDATN